LQLQDIINALKEYGGRPVSIMEVCGTHTAAIAKCGIRSMIPDRIRLVSGPGCPVCVTVPAYIDRLCELAHAGSHEVVTFGDMMRVPGTKGSLMDQKARGGRVRMVYSPFDCLSLAKADPQTIYVFAAVGFETTAPIYAMMMEQAEREGIRNIRFLTSVKTMPGAIEWICAKNSGIDGFIAPGHVSVITGSEMYRPIAEKYHIPFAVASFDGPGILAAVYSLLRLKGKGSVVNLYPSAVREKGNGRAAELLNRYFEPGEAFWRGMGGIPGSGLYLREEFLKYYAGSRENMRDAGDTGGCRCGDVLTGKLAPAECPYFGTACTPQSPKGACMVSMEGACYSWYSYERTGGK
jgi:hydrogenase expression/formation protein HypD